jgi:hypothetical protein
MFGPNASPSFPLRVGGPDVDPTVGYHPQGRVDMVDEGIPTTGGGAGTDGQPPATTPLSVLIPTADRSALLDAALRSLDRQVFRDFEVVIVNDGGAPLEDVVSPWRARMPITFVDLPDRRGPAGARNIGIDLCQGEAIAFLDDDDVFLPDHLATCAALMAETGADLVYAGAIVAERRVDGGVLPLDAGRHRKAYPFDQRFLLVANFLHTGSVVVRNVRDLDCRFDQALSVCEDWDFWLAVTVAHGFDVAFSQHLTSVYHQVPGNRGLVAGGQETSPSAFDVARQRIHGKWPSDDAFVVASRAWMSALEDRRNRRIELGRAIPTHLFDRVLDYVAVCVGSSTEPRVEDIDALFDESWAPARSASRPSSSARTSS